MTENVELVEQNAGLRSEARGREAKGFPHVHHRKSQAGGFSRAEPGIELLQARPRSDQYRRTRSDAAEGARGPRCGRPGPS